MNRFLAVSRTRAGWCLTLLLSEFVLTGAAQAPANVPTPSPAPAESPALHLSLAQAQGIAFQRNWDLLAARSGIDSAAIEKPISPSRTRV